MVDYALTVVDSRRTEVLYGQVPDRYISCLLGEGVKILVLTVENRARSSDERVTVCGDDLVVLACPEGMPTWREPVGCIRPHGPAAPENSSAVIACRDDHGPLGRDGGAALKDCLIAAYPRRRRCGTCAPGSRASRRGCRASRRGCRASRRGTQDRQRQPYEASQDNRSDSGDCYQSAAGSRRWR